MPSPPLRNAPDKPGRKAALCTSVKLLSGLALAQFVVLCGPYVISELALIRGSLEGDRREQLGYLWGLVVLIQWGLCTYLMVLSWPDVVQIVRSTASPVFWSYAFFTLVVILYMFVLPLWRPSSMPDAWRCSVEYLVGRPTTIVISVGVGYGAAVSAIIAGIAGAQFLEARGSLTFEQLVTAFRRIRASFASTSVIMTLSVFAIARFQEIVFLPSADSVCSVCSYSKNAALATALLLSALIVILFLPSMLQYHGAAQRLVRERYPIPSDYDKDAYETRRSVEQALGLTVLSGLETIVGVLAPILGSLGDSR